MNFVKSVVAAVLATSVSSIALAQEGSADAGASKIAVCVACHGQDGIGILPEYPTLAGQHADYLEQALKDYRKGRRQNAIMNGFAGALTDADIKALAAYYAAQKGLYTPTKR
jgi:cytochrome c553